MSTAEQDDKPEPAPYDGGWFFRPGAGYFVLWIVLWLMVVGKFAVVRGFAAPELLHLGALLAALLILPWGAACVAWRVSGGKRLKAELTWLAVATLLFLVQTAQLYREAIAAG